MAVLITAEVPGQTKEGYSGMLSVLEAPLKATPGFIMHAAYERDGVWCVLEVWDTQEAATEFFAKYIHPNLPPGVKPKRRFHELHAIVRTP